MAVDPEIIEHVRRLYAPPDDPVFELVPPEFDYHTNMIYVDVGSPSIAWDNIRDIYSTMIKRLEEIYFGGQDPLYDEYKESVDLSEVQHLLDEEVGSGENGPQPVYNFIPGRDLAGGTDHVDANGPLYLGGVNGGLGLGLCYHSLPSTYYVVLTVCHRQGRERGR